jgi:hypothetical protein
MRKKCIDLSDSRRGNRLKRGNGDGMKKRYLKSRPYCKVTFKLPKETVEKAHRVCVVGDFNSWDNNFTLMKKLRNGDFSVTLNLERECPHNCVN